MKKLLLLLILVSTFTFAQDGATALNFDGTNDYVNAGTDNVFNFNDASTFTIEAWIKPSTTTTAKTIVARDSWSEDKGWVFKTENRRLYFKTPTQEIVTDVVLSDNEWSHVAVTFSATSVVIYANGDDVAFGNLSIKNLDGQSLYFGARHNNGGVDSTDYFEGNMDELRIWSTSKTRTEIMDNRHCALSGNEVNLLSYFNFNQGVENQDNLSEKVLKSSNPIYNANLLNFDLTGSSSNYIKGTDNGVDSCDTLSTSTSELESGISIFPNPARDTFNLRNANTTSLNNATIIDINGRIVSKINLDGMNSGVKTLNISHLKSGLYLVKIESDNASVTKKLIIQ